MVANEKRPLRAKTTPTANSNTPRDATRFWIMSEGATHLLLRRDALHVME